MLFACTPVEEESNIFLPKTLKEAVTLYNDKLTSLLESDATDTSSSNILTRFYNDTPYNPDDMLPKETYLEIYNQQKDNSNHVNLNYYLTQYKDLLDEINLLLESFDIDEFEANIQIDFQGKTIDAYIYLSRDYGVVVKFSSKSIFTDAPIFYGIKMGYENNVFFVKELKHYKDNNVYNYFEFLENISLIDIDYRDEENYKYHYINQEDNELFKIYRASDINGQDDYVLTWFNPETNIRAIYSDGHELVRHFEVFNEKTSIFDYSDYSDGSISLRFQLLEASGWDFAYLDSNAHRNQGVYKDGVMLFQEDQYRQFNVDLNHEYKFANVGVTIDLQQEELTNDILSLKVYQMNFNHPEITTDYIATTLDTLYEESKHLAVYRGIDFYSGNIKETLYHEMDDDLKESLND